MARRAGLSRQAWQAEQSTLCLSCYCSVLSNESPHAEGQPGRSRTSPGPHPPSPRRPASPRPRSSILKACGEQRSLSLEPGPWEEPQSLHQGYNTAGPSRLPATRLQLGKLGTGLPPPHPEAWLQRRPYLLPPGPNLVNTPLPARAVTMPQTGHHPPSRASAPPSDLPAPGPLGHTYDACQRFPLHHVHKLDGDLFPAAALGLLGAGAQVGAADDALMLHQGSVPWRLLPRERHLSVACPGRLEERRGAEDAFYSGSARRFYAFCLWFQQPGSSSTPLYSRVDRAKDGMHISAPPLRPMCLWRNLHLSEPRFLHL